MIQLRLQPTFELKLRDARSEVISKLEEYCRDPDKTRDFRIHGEYGEIHLSPSETRLWSPHLNFYVEEAAEGQPALDPSDTQEEGSLVHGRFAPRLHVWTFVWAVYLMMSFSAFFGAALAYSQWMLNESPWGLYVILFAGAVVFGLHVVACTGQHLSEDQMDQLKARLTEILHDARITLCS